MLKRELPISQLKSTSSYYQMGVELSEAVKNDTKSNITMTLEESQGSVQNIMEVKGRTNNYVFTTPPVLIKLAQGGKAMFRQGHPRFNEVRALFPIPLINDAFCDVR